MGTTGLPIYEVSQTVEIPKLVGLLYKFGPNRSQIAKSMGKSQSYVNYHYRKLIRRGMAVQAAADYESLGLRRIIIIMTFSETYESYSQSILAAMSELCYVASFSKTIPYGSYVVHATAPTEHVNAYIDLIRQLKTIGILASFEAIVFDSSRYVPMRTEYYDFEFGTWDFDFSSRAVSEKVGEVISEKTTFDLLDLQIIRELQIDADQSVGEISRKLDQSYRSLREHYVQHVISRGMVKNYIVNWSGVRYDFKIEKALHRRHRYFILDIIVRNVSEEERTNLRMKIDSLPFVYSEAYGKSYFAELAVPLEYLSEVYAYLGEPLKTMKDKTLGVIRAEIGDSVVARKTVLIPPQAGVRTA